MPQDKGVPLSSQGRATGPSDLSPASGSSRSSVPNAVLDAVAFAIERARCPGREGPYGGYDYGHNTDFYGPAPVGGRYVVRDFRDYRSPAWGAWVHQTDSHDEHEQAYLRLTGRHIAQAAIAAYASGIVAATAGETACGLDERSEQSPAPEGGDAQQPQSEVK